MTDSIQNTEKTPVYKKIMVMVAMISFMAGSITGIMTYATLGFTEDFFSRWLTAFVTAAVFMAPAGMLLMTLFTKLVDWMLPQLSQLPANIVVGLMMAFAMETIMSTTTAATQVGFSDLVAYSQAWTTAFITAIPMGLTIGLGMSIFVKPKLQKFMAS